MGGVIEIEGLRKEYRRIRGGSTMAVDGLDLEVPEGGVFGFLGPNGSGKTTTIRVLLGLVRATSGRARMLGAEVPGALASVVPDVGSIVETPALFPGFSGRTNLRLLGGIDGIGPRTVDAVLERVGLAERAGDKVKQYSLGMKQRLGVAAALLKDPALLILDEPANGLDPAGIREMRELIRVLGAEGRTVFVSSHLLSEVQQTCDRVAILTRGRCVRSGPVQDVLTSGRAAAMLVRATDLDGAAGALATASIPCEQRDGHLRVALAPEEAARITQVLAAQEIWVTDLRPDEATLEDVFLELTGEPHVPMAEPPTTPSPPGGDA